jgi:hypothetical protein
MGRAQPELRKQEPSKRRVTWEGMLYLTTLIPGSCAPSGKSEIDANHFDPLRTTTNTFALLTASGL